ncbi:MAG: 2-C-methyl-D-erythritol 4-phosphate cytidylyltransferase [Opitutales bacterium]|nr:2-C-methyl-D-erythritol 4-phosphate cytidylyltransferase [Opitutales bacterium]MCH8539924.1 2-C-methyl-D-erythritol 4-phosphate cytidylyltransferase [Opitutales bacterium]
MTTPSKRAFILLAAGSSRRMEDVVRDKILHRYEGLSPLQLLGKTIGQLRQTPEIVIVYRDSSQKEALAKAWGQTLPVLWVQGGRERRDSVWAALQALPSSTSLVAIHDGARPLVRPEQIDELYERTAEHGAAALAHQVRDSLKMVSGDPLSGTATPLKSLPREGLWAMETPQVFDFPEITKAYAGAICRKLPLTDDLGAWETTGKPCYLLPNRHPNPKITTPADSEWLESYLRSRKDLVTK